MARPQLSSLVLLSAVLVICVQQAHFGKLTNSIESRRRNFAERAAQRAVLSRCPPPRAEGANLPLVQIKKRSSNRFLCNGVLVTNQMILTTANCVDEITNTSKYSVGFKGPFRNSTTTSWMSISWACKQPEFEPARSAHHNTGLIVLDRPIEARHYECLLQAHKVNPHVLSVNTVQQHRGHSRAANLPSHHELHLVRIHNDEPTISRLQSLESSLTCLDNDIGAPHEPTGKSARRHRNRQASVCRIQVDAEQLSQSSGGDGGGGGLCNLEGAFVLVISRRAGASARRLTSGPQLAPASSSMLGLVDIENESLDSNGCLEKPSGKGLELRMLNLSKLWADGQLNRLINHCSISRR